MKKILLEIVLWTWCLPQTLIAHILKLCLKKYTTVGYENSKVYYTNLTKGSVSLSNKIFLCKAHFNNDDVIKHEYGHYKQNLYLGWLYLPIICLPSLIWAGCFESYRQRKQISYYSFYTEKWANKLMNIKLK